MIIAEVQFLLWVNSTHFTESLNDKSVPKSYISGCGPLHWAELNFSSVTRSSFAFAWESVLKLNRN